MKRYILIYNSASVQFAISDEKKKNEKNKKKNIFWGAASSSVDPVAQQTNITSVGWHGFDPHKKWINFTSTLSHQFVRHAIGGRAGQWGTGIGGGDLWVLWLAPRSLRQRSFHLCFPESQKSV